MMRITFATKNRRRFSRILTGLLSLLLLLLTLANVAPQSAYAKEDSPYKIVIDDSADLLAEGEEKKLEEAASHILQYGNVCIYTTNVNGEASTKDLAEKKCKQLFGEESSMIFVIDMDERMVYLAQEGELKDRISSAQSRSITDNVYTYAKDRNYYQCVNQVLRQYSRYLQRKDVPETMRHVCNLLIALVLSVIIIYAAVQLTLRKRVAEDEDIIPYIQAQQKLLDDSMKITGSIVIESSSSSSWGGGIRHSGGSRGGGGFHGGGGGFSGGGHRF